MPYCIFRTPKAAARSLQPSPPYIVLKSIKTLKDSQTPIHCRLSPSTASGGWLAHLSALPALFLWRQYTQHLRPNPEKSIRPTNSKPRPPTSTDMGSDGIKCYCGKTVKDAKGLRNHMRDSSRHHNLEEFVAGTRTGVTISHVPATSRGDSGADSPRETKFPETLPLMRGTPFGERRVGGTSHNGAAPILWVGIHTPPCGREITFKGKERVEVKA